MPSFLLTVDGTERDVKLESLSVQHVVNGPDILEGLVQDEDGSVSMALDDVVELVQTDVSPTATYFKGLLITKSSETWTDHGYGRLRRITAFDFSVYASFVQVFEFEVSTGSPVHTISTLLADLVADYLTEYGVTVHPSQATGPVLEANAFDGQTVDAVLNAISEQTGWVWKIDADNQIRMWDPATELAGFNVTATNGTYIGDIRADHLRQRYYNRVFVEGGDGYWQQILGERHDGDGVATTFPMNAPMFYYENDYTATLGYMVGLSLTVVRTGGTTIEHANDQLTAQWTFNRGPEYSLTQVSGAVLGPTEYFIVGSHAESGYSAQWPMRLVADGRGSPPAPARDLRVRRPTLFGRAAIQALADALLAASQVEFDRRVYVTDEVDIRPGETQTIVVPEAEVNGTYTAVSVRLAYVPNGDTTAFRREVTAVSALTARSFWLDLYDRWLQDNQIGSTQAAFTPGGTVAPAQPTLPAGADTQVQYNDGGVFGAEAAFTYTKGTNTLNVSTVKSQVGEVLALSATAPAQVSGAGAGKDITLAASAATTGSGAGCAAGGAVVMTAGNAAGQTSGSANGGAVSITGGTALGTGVTTPVGGAISVTGGTGAAGLNSPGGAVSITGGTGVNLGLGGAVAIAGGTSGASNGGVSGAVSILSGAPAGTLNSTGAVSIASANVTSGQTISVSGAVTLASGASGAWGVPGTVSILGGSPPNNSASLTSPVGAAIAITAGAGGANSATGLSNTAGNGGTLAITAGAGGANSASGAGITHAAGHGAAATMVGGAGGNATGSGGTRNGGNGGDVVLQPGAAGTGATANGTAGKINLDAVRICVSTSLPTSDPGVPGQLYHLSGVLMVSL